MIKFTPSGLSWVLHLEPPQVCVKMITLRCCPFTVPYLHKTGQGPSQLDLPHAQRSSRSRPKAPGNTSAIVLGG